MLITEPITEDLAAFYCDMKDAGIDATIVLVEPTAEGDVIAIQVGDDDDPRAA